MHHCQTISSTHSHLHVHLQEVSEVPGGRFQFTISFAGKGEGARYVKAGGIIWENVIIS